MTGRDFVESNIQLSLKREPAYGGPYPELIFRDTKGRVLGEYLPILKDNRWSGGDKNRILDKEIISWYITWDIQDIDVVQFWITVETGEDDKA